MRPKVTKVAPSPSKCGSVEATEFEPQIQGLSKAIFKVAISTKLFLQLFPNHYNPRKPCKSKCGKQFFVHLDFYVKSISEILTIFEVLNFDFWEFVQFLKVDFY